MALRRQFVLDRKTDRLLKRLAENYAGNRSHVVREAIQYYADIEARLDQIESDPGFQKMMADSDRAIREGRVTPHEEVMRMSRAQAKKRKSA
jgi:predicted transcriptional regulator